MTEPPNTPEQPERPRFDTEEAHKFLLALTALVGVPLFLVFLVWKGMGAALGVALMVVLVWLHVADVIPAQREIDAMRRKAGPIERVIVAILAAILIVICVGFMLSPKETGPAVRTPSAAKQEKSGLTLRGGGPVTGERLLEEMLRKN
jgi:hypothetical protein